MYAIDLKQEEKFWHMLAFSKKASKNYPFSLAIVFASFFQKAIMSGVKSLSKTVTQDTEAILRSVFGDERYVQITSDLVEGKLNTAALHSMLAETGKLPESSIK
jgi:hypothetical protein